MEEDPLFIRENKSSKCYSISLIIFVLLMLIILALIAGFTSVDRTTRKSENKCSSLNDSFPELRPFIESNNQTIINNNSKMIVLKNAKIWNGKGQVINNGQISFQNGKIVQVGENINIPNDAEVIDVEGRYVTPGIVDMHSHLGDYSYPDDAFGTQDGNEATNPTFPQLRSMDALNPNDPAIDVIRGGGVTTALVLPGSANVMGGEATFVKLKGKTQRNMIIQNPPRAVKMACGENPKRVYGSRNQTPSSRMGNIWLMRSKFFDAYRLKQQQEQWDCLNEKNLATTARPEDISLQILVDILKGEVLPQIHCYKVEDLESVMRTAKEFNFNVSAFHHAVEAWKIPDLLKEKNIGVAIFADLWGFKMEGYNGSVNAGKIFEEAGVTFAYKTDHPVLLGSKLIFEAQKARYYGVSEQQAIASVTSVPAKLIGLSKRLGSLEEGLDADILVWTRYPLDIGAVPQMTFIDGELFDKRDEPLHPDPILTPTSTLSSSGATACQQNVNSPKQAVVGGNVFSFDDSDTVYNNATILIENGIITCISSTPGQCVYDNSFNVYDVKDATILPGTINVHSLVGQTAVDQESASSTGSAVGEDIRATDGVFLNMYSDNPGYVKEAFIGGVTSLIARPLGGGLVKGIGGNFYLHGIDVEEEIQNDYASLEISFGSGGKTGTTASVAAQVAYLRKQFSAPPVGSVWERVVNKSIPLVSYTHQVDYISHLLKLQSTFAFNLVIVGGGEAHLIASKIAAQNVSVILKPYHVLQFANWNSVQNSMKILEDAGVNVGLTETEASHIRNIRWEAGRFQTLGASRDTALKSFTKNIAKAYNLYDSGLGQIKQNTNANFVVYNGDPLNFQGHPILIVLKQKAFCNPTPY